jgi:beta-lactam-binding protein with PASTA domain
MVRPVPNLKGLTVATARNEYPRLNVQEVGQSGAERPAGEILTQRPPPGSPMPLDLTVRVTVSLGPRRIEPSPLITPTGSISR